MSATATSPVPNESHADAEEEIESIDTNMKREYLKAAKHELPFVSEQTKIADTTHRRIVLDCQTRYIFSGITMVLRV